MAVKVDAIEIRKRTSFSFLIRIEHIYVKKGGVFREKWVVSKKTSELSKICKRGIFAVECL